MPLYSFNCKKCDQNYELILSEKDFIKQEYRKYCTRSCANSRVMTEDRRQNISISMMSINTCKIFYRKCHCGKLMTLRNNKKHHKQYCSEDCLAYRKMLSEKARNRKTCKRSKNEILFSKLCISFFDNVECNVPIFNGWDADVVIHDLKIAILWNGKWHYEKCSLKHSVKQVQNRDAIKTDEIINCGYTPYVIKDLGKFNSQKVKNEFMLFVASIGSAPIISPYERDVILLHQDAR